MSISHLIDILYSGLVGWAKGVLQPVQVGVYHNYQNVVRPIVSCGVVQKKPMERCVEILRSVAHLRHFYGCG